MEIIKKQNAQNVNQFVLIKISASYETKCVVKDGEKMRSICSCKQCQKAHERNENCIVIRDFTKEEAEKHYNAIQKESKPKGTKRFN